MRKKKTPSSFLLRAKEIGRAATCSISRVHSCSTRAQRVAVEAGSERFLTNLILFPATPTPVPAYRARPSSAVSNHGHGAAHIDLCVAGIATAGLVDVGAVRGPETTSWEIGSSPTPCRMTTQSSRRYETAAQIFQRLGCEYVPRNKWRAGRLNR